MVRTLYNPTIQLGTYNLGRLDEYWGLNSGPWDARQALYHCVTLLVQKHIIIYLKTCAYFIYIDEKKFNFTNKQRSRNKCIIITPQIHKDRDYTPSPAI